MRFFAGLLILFILGTGIPQLAAQNVNVAGAVVGNGTYATLNAAFTAINGGGQSAANITITIVGNTVEGVSATLNQSAAVWATVTITPIGARTIAGSINGNLINLNGADNVTIDGLNSGGNSLGIINQNTSATASTIQFINDAKGNTVSNCSIQGSSTGAANSAFGATILFSSVALGSGNDNNIISFNDIGPFGSSLPFQAIKSYGTAGKENKNNTIDNNLIHDFFSGSANNSRGVLAFINTTTWTISNNRMYQSAPRVWTASSTNVYTCIDIQSGSGYTISGNTLGFANSAGTGYTIFTGASNIANHVHAIIMSPTTAIASTISSNTIGGFDVTSSRTALANGSIFLGIYLNILSTGTNNVIGNTIGSATSTGSIYIRHTAVSGTGCPPVAAIYSAGGTNLISDNIIGGMDLSYAGAVGLDLISLTGIWNMSPLSVTIRNNTIGGNVANSMTSTHLGGSVIGINNGQATVAVKIQGNTIQNLTHTNANVGVGAAASVIGILEKPTAGTVGNEVSGNLIYNLSNSFGSTTSVIQVNGIVLNPFGALSQITLVERNTIHSLNVNSTAVGSSINGIDLVANGTGNVFNNMISLGNGITGNKKIIGILQTGMTIFAYHNSIRIMGTASGTDLSACYSYTTGGFVYRSWNSLYYNERTGGANNHYALHTLAAVTGYQASYNLYYTAGPAFALYNNVARANLAALFAGTNPNNNPTNTKQLPVVFTSATDLHTSDLNVRNAGFSPLNPVVTLDIDSTLRPACVDIGCDEFDLASIPGTAYTWLGTKDTKWCEPCNWDRELVPAATDDAIIADSLARYPLLVAGTLAGNPCDNVAIHDLTIQQNVNPLKSGNIDLATYTLSVSGDISIAGTCTCTGSTALGPLNTGLIDLTGTTQSQSVDIRGADGTYPGTICKLRVNKTAPTGVASANHEAYLRGNLIILYNLDLANGVLLSKTAGSFDANEMTAANYKTITLQSDEPAAVTRPTIASQNLRNGFFQGRLLRKIRSGAVANEYLYPLGYRAGGGSGVLGDYFYTPALLKNNSIANNQYLTGTYLNDQNNPTADGVGIGFTGHGCLNAFEIDDQGGATATTCNDKEIDVLSTFYWDFQESTGPAVNGDPVTSPGALGAVSYDLECAGDVFNLQAMDGLTGSELRLLQRPSVVIPGNAGQGPFVTTVGTHDGTDISPNTGIALYSIAAANLQGARRDGLSTFGGFGSAGNGPSPLPIELLFFQAERAGDKHVLCSWETATETNNDHFEVEAARQQDGDIVFENIGIVKGSGSSSQPHSYSFVDEHPVIGKNYYRLRQVDYDGTAGLSKIVVIVFNSGRKFDILSISPNPFISQPVVYLQAKESGTMTIEVENSIGQVVYKQELFLTRGGSNLVLALPEGLSSGLYLVRSNFNGEQQVSRLLKQ